MKNYQDKLSAILIIFVAFLLIGCADASAITLFTENGAGQFSHSLDLSVDEDNVSKLPLDEVKRLCNSILEEDVTIEEEGVGEFKCSQPNRFFFSTESLGKSYLKLNKETDDYKLSLEINALEINDGELNYDIDINRLYGNGEAVLTLNWFIAVDGEVLETNGKLVEETLEGLEDYSIVKWTIVGDMSSSTEKAGKNLQLTARLNGDFETVDSQVSIPQPSETPTISPPTATPVNADVAAPVSTVTIESTPTDSNRSDNFPDLWILLLGGVCLGSAVIGAVLIFFIWSVKKKGQAVHLGSSRELNEVNPAPVHKESDLDQSHDSQRKFCSQCGVQLSNRSKFCSNCGKDVGLD